MASASPDICYPNGTTLFQSRFTKSELHNWHHDYFHVNGERQIYTNTSSNIDVVDGALVLSALRQPNGDWTSARVRTAAEWLYFRMDVTFKLDKVSPGAFPSIFILPRGDKVSWPKDGEIDLMEFNTVFPNTPLIQTIQTQYGNSGTGIAFYNCRPDVTNFVKVSVIKLDKSIQFLCNDVESGTYNRPDPFTISQWPYSQEYPFGLTIAYAVEPQWSARVPDNIDTLKMTISNVTVYDCNPAPSIPVTSLTSVTTATGVPEPSKSGNPSTFNSIALLMIFLFYFLK
ncbi:concanavalin A-like lectin/glucanase domain-containing protein [Globomyces pollinis-pini]|nr:concanavalin A-like lectin/glucanase domain-containing protein [Globomyces pollinis-pini]